MDSTHAAPFIDDRFNAIWPAIAERPVPQVTDLPAVSREDLDRAKIQVHYGDAEERTEALALVLGAMLRAVEGQTWQELLDQIPAESRDFFARILIGGLLGLDKENTNS